MRELDELRSLLRMSELRRQRAEAQLVDRDRRLSELQAELAWLRRPANSAA